jgi:hypothetical protein
MILTNCPLEQSETPSNVKPSVSAVVASRAQVIFSEFSTPLELLVSVFHWICGGPNIIIHSHPFTNNLWSIPFCCEEFYDGSMHLPHKIHVYTEVGCFMLWPYFKWTELKCMYNIRGILDQVATCFIVMQSQQLV